MCLGQGLLQEAPEHLGLQEASLPPEEAHTPCTMCNTSAPFQSQNICIFREVSLLQWKRKRTNA